MEKNTPILHLSLHHLIRECSNGKKTNEEMFNDFSIKNSEVIHDVFKYRKFNDDFVDTITLYSDDEDYLGKFRPCYYDFSTKLVRLLDCHYKNDDLKLTELLNEKIEELSNITQETELKNKFHLIFDDLLNGRSYLNNLESSSLDKNSDEYKAKEKYFYRCGLRRSLDGFIKTQTEVYKRFVNKRYEYGTKTLDIDFNDYMNQYFDMDKVELIVIDKIIKLCANTSDLTTLKSLRPVLKKFINKKTHSRESVHTIDGKELAPYDVEVRAISMGINILKLEDEKNIHDHRKLIKEGTSNTIKKKEKIGQIKMTPKELGNLKRIAKDKVSFYEKHPSYFDIIGEVTTAGYDRARVYKNGEVILDTEYKENPKGAAAFNYRIEDYDELKGLTASELKENEKVKRIPHRPGWESELEEIINREATDEDIEKVEAFQKTHK